jgi:hypothetical protein
VEVRPYCFRPFLCPFLQFLGDGFQLRHGENGVGMFVNLFLCISRMRCCCVFRVEEGCVVIVLELDMYSNVGIEMYR